MNHELRRLHGLAAYYHAIGAWGFAEIIEKHILTNYLVKTESSVIPISVGVKNEKEKEASKDGKDRKIA